MKWLDNHLKRCGNCRFIMAVAVSAMEIHHNTPQNNRAQPRRRGNMNRKDYEMAKANHQTLIHWPSCAKPQCDDQGHYTSVGYTYDTYYGWTPIMPGETSKDQSSNPKVLARVLPKHQP